MYRAGVTGPATRCIHAGERRAAAGALRTPVYPHATFGFASNADLLDVVDGRREGNLYTRFGHNPTIRALEEKVADIEGGEAGLAFASGMAAEAATILSLAGAGDHVVCVGDVYGGTHELLDRELRTLGVETTFLVGGEIGDLGAVLGRPTRLVLFETPTNPGLDLIDIAATAAVAHRHGAVVVVDNTFATPVNQNPLLHGADLVVHSATKYLGGHDDLTAGVVVGPERLIAPIRAWRRSLGQIIAPEAAALLARSIATLVVRVRAQNAGAQAVAAFLAGHPRVDGVRHPSLVGGRDAALVGRQMPGGGGGMVTFTHAGGGEAAAAMLDRLRLFAIAPSLGGIESLAVLPVAVTHHGMPAAERRRRGITDALVRLSIGLEDPADLIADLAGALDP
jgi:cystathionine gamma-synthase/methionine-gamma-lyase